MLKSLSEVWNIYVNSVKKSLDSFIVLGVEFTKLDLASYLLALLSFVPIVVFLLLFGQSLLGDLLQTFSSEDPSLLISSLTSLFLSPAIWIIFALYLLILLALSPIFYSLSLYKYVLVSSKKPTSILDYTKVNYSRFFIFGVLSFAILIAVLLPSFLFAYLVPFVGFCIFILGIFLLLIWGIFAMPYAAINVAISDLSPLDSIKNAFNLVKSFPGKTFFYLVLYVLSALPFIALNFVFEFIWTLIYQLLLSSSVPFADVLDFFVLNVGSYLIMLPFVIFSVIFVYNVWKSIQK